MSEFSPVSRTLLVTAACVIVIAGMKQASELFVPFLLSVFIAVISYPAINSFQKKGINKTLSVAIVVSIVFIFGLLIAWLIGSSIDNFTDSLPRYQQEITSLWSRAIQWLSGFGVTIPDSLLVSNLDPGAAMKLIAAILSGFGNVMANSFLIFITVIFILSEAGSLRAKIIKLGGGSYVGPEFTEKLNMYMGIKTIMSLITGLLVTLLLWSLGVEYAQLWGVLAFIFNFIPNIGSIIAAIPAVLLSSFQLGMSTTLLVIAGYLVINIVIGAIIEPRFMGKGVGLSALVVFLSLVFWGWVLGPVGMLLSVPLTITAKLALDSNPETRKFGSLLDSES